MSVSGIIASNGKIYNDLLPNPYPYPAQAPPLAQVLIAGQNAGNQNISNLNQLETTNIVQQAPIGGHLSIGGAGGDLRIQGATIKGSILAGNGTSTSTLPLGTNGYVLTADSTAGVGVKWAVGGGVASVSAGTNITIPNPAIPVVALSNPLTSVLNLGTQNITGSTSQITLTNGNDKAVQQATTGFISSNTAVPAQNSTLYKTGLTISTPNDALAVSASTIQKTGSNALSIASNTPIHLSGSFGGGGGIQIAQQTGANTTLTTNIANVNYYPDFVLTNQDSNTVSVPAPSLQYERLTLNNLGLTNINNWNNYGNNIPFAGYSAFFIDGNSYVWLAEQGSGNIQIWDNTISTLQYSLNLTYGGGVGNINTIYYSAGYVWIGGQFDTVIDANGTNAVPQYSITRVNASYFFDPIDGVQGIQGFQIGSEVYCMTEVNGALVCGGSFSTFSNGNVCNYIGSISYPYAGSGSQLFYEYANGVNDNVFAIYHSSTYNYTFVGGDFNIVNVSSSPISSAYCAYYDNGGFWDLVGSSYINAQVVIIKPSFNGNILIAGSFTSLNGATQDYNAYIEEGTPSNFSNTTLNTGGFVPQYKYGTFANYQNVMIGFDYTFYTSSAYQTWTNLGQIGQGGQLTGINYWNGNWKVIGDSNSASALRSYAPLLNICAFTGSFKYSGTPYTVYTITTTNVSQQFLGDYASASWSIIGQGVGAFS